MKLTRILFLVFIFSLIVDIRTSYVPSYISDIRMFGVILLWGIVLWRMKLTSRATFVLTLLLLLVMTPLYIINQASPMVERIATYLYLFLWVGVIHGIIEVVRKPQKKSKRSST